MKARPPSPPRSAAQHPAGTHSATTQGATPVPALVLALPLLVVPALALLPTLALVKDVAGAAVGARPAQAARMALRT